MQFVQRAIVIVPIRTDKGAVGPPMSLDSFARLFRRSAWAKFNTAQVYTPVPVESMQKLPTFKPASDRPAHFGFKKDLPASYFGKRPHHVAMKDLDGDFGQAVFSHAGGQAHLHTVLKELQAAMESGARVPIRILNKTAGGGEGFCVGFAGLVGYVPEEELPEGYRFSFNDMLHRRAYWAWVKGIEAEDRYGKPFVSFSFRRQPPLRAQQ